MNKSSLRYFLVCFLVTAMSGLGWGQESQLREDIRKNNKSIAGVKVKLKEANRREKEIADKLAHTRERKDAAQQALDKVEKELSVAKEKLRQLQVRMRRTSIRLLRSQRALEARLRDIYMQGEVSYLAVLLQSEDFTDFLNQADYLKLIVKSDSQLINGVKKHRQDLSVQQEAARVAVSELKSLKAQRKDQYEAIARLQTAQTQLYDKLISHQASLRGRIDELEEISAQKEKKLRELIKRRSRPAYPTYVPAPRSAGGYIYPVNGPITSYFGYRVHPIYGTTRLHTGMDFGVGYGVPILAADNGVVIHSGWYGGYGNTVILDHGGGYTTLYAHASSLAVSAGQTVRQGQMVSRCGSTGNSTGPHLHFEVRYHGNPINPLSRL